MPPRKKPTAPASRIYKSSTPLVQSRFPDRRKRVTYGKSATRRAPNKPRLEKQDTLTQMDFIRLQQLQEEEDEAQEEEEDVSYDDDIEKPRKKRRKTEGDLGDHSDEERAKKVPKRREAIKGRRKTEGDKPTSTPQYHTQTITQIPDWITPAPEISPESRNSEDDLAEDSLEPISGAPDIRSGDSIFDIPSSSQMISIPNKKANVLQAANRGTQPSKGTMAPPHTPRRTLAFEIPSSESPASPLSTHSRTSCTRLPLEEKSTNTPIAFNLHRKPQRSPDKLPRLEVKDTFDTATQVSQLTGGLSTPAKKSSPPKSVRFTLPDDEEPPPPSPTRKQQSTSYPLQNYTSKLEISDSDADSDEDLDTEQLVDERVNSEPQQETCYGEIGRDTQLHIDQLLSSPILTDPVECFPPLDEHGTDRSDAYSLQGSPTLSEVIEESQAEIEQLEADSDNYRSYSIGLNDIVKESQLEERSEEPDEERTQFVESQRLATQHIAVMAPRTPGSDVFVMLHSQQVSNMLSRKKNHDFRNWAYPKTVGRIWIYEPKPTQILKYMAVIGHPQHPGQLTDESGIGNVDFNAKPANWRAYEILEMYELADPLSLAELKTKEWLLSPPPRFQAVPPVVLDTLMANLQPPLFTKEPLDGPDSSSSDTQEAEAQLLSTIKQYTQVSSSPPTNNLQQSKNATGDEVVPSSQQDYPPPVTRTNLSQATTVDLTQTQTPRNVYEHEIIWESPIHPVPASTPVILPTPRHGVSDLVQESIVPYSIASSQMLTKSQILAETYVDESLPAPPLFVQDSDEEED